MTPQIQKPAPEFQGTAVIDGQFKEIKLSDYKGKYLVRFETTYEQFSFISLVIFFNSRFSSFTHWTCEYPLKINRLSDGCGAIIAFNRNFINKYYSREKCTR